MLIFRYQINGGREMSDCEIHGNIIVMTRKVKLDSCQCYPDKPKHMRVCDDINYWYECIKCGQVVSKKF